VATPARAAAAASVAAASAPDPVIRWAALPEAVRSSLPALAWSGGVYAEQPAQRLVVVNGQVAREGDELAPGLRLEQIRPKAVVVRWRGQRIELPM
ncbi:MAG: general secretion pathway protein GspB, partial [Aquabacterium sp.]|nr:general secretion pathway protein GspB [Aquabacterium sp.]